MKTKTISYKIANATVKCVFMCSAHSLPAHFFIKMFAKYKFKPYLNSVKCGCVFTGRQLHLLFSCPFLFNSKVIQLFNELYNFIDLCLTSANFIMNFPFYFFSYSVKAIGWWFLLSNFMQNTTARESDVHDQRAWWKETHKDEN